MEFLKGLGFGVILIGFYFWLTGRKWLNDEIQRNDSFDPPSSRQLRWDIRHIREDLHMLVLILNAILLTLVFSIAYFKFF